MVQAGTQYMLVNKEYLHVSFKTQPKHRWGNYGAERMCLAKTQSWQVAGTGCDLGLPASSPGLSLFYWFPTSIIKRLFSACRMQDTVVNTDV